MFGNCLFNCKLFESDDISVYTDRTPEGQCQQQPGTVYFEAQSGTTSDNSIMKVSGESTYQNVNFGDQHDPYMYSVETVMDPTRKLMDSDDAQLGNFLSRPIKIHEEEWGTGSNLFFSINPWALYMENPRVINRISNFNLLRATLKLKIVINGNGFQYGRALASYNPLDIWDDLSQNRALVPQDAVQASQMPHIYLDPTTSTGGEMSLPFFDYRNYVNIPESDWQELGVLTVRSLNALKHANGASDQVTISVFAWVEDTSMAVLTSTDPSTLSPQSGREIDEANTKGMISGPATAIQKAATVLASVPQIAPFATATAAGAGVVANVAKALGYCRPPVTKDPEPYRPHGNASLALTTVPDGTSKMTIDDKQELSIDPRLAGLGAADPLNIKEIAKRESYLTTFSWNIGTSPETLLWNARIDPCTWAENGLTPKGFHFPACAMAALPFKYWTGKMKFRFQIVCSAFHKGRLKIVYDPNFLAGSEYNTNYLEVVDIADKSDFTIEIGNGQATTLLTHAEPGINSVTEMYSTTAYASRNPGNGVIGVYVVNELTTPNSTVNNDIEVNVFVSMGDDFETFVPNDTFQKFVFKPQSGSEIVPEGQNTAEPSAPQQEQSSEVGPGYTNHGLVNKVFTGEAISSFRTLLKRYNLHQSLIFGENSSPRVHYGRRSMFPYLRGNVSGAVNVTGLGAPYSYCNTVLLHWVTYAFAGWRGGIRWKILPRGEMDVDRDPQVYIQRAPLGGFEYQKGSTTTIAQYATDQDSAASVVVRSGSYPQSNAPLSGPNGLVFAQGKVNPNIEFECPFYSPFRFSPGKTENYTGLGLFTESWDYRIFVDANVDTCFDAYCAAAEDFQCYFFTGLPVMYYEADPPNPL